MNSALKDINFFKDNTSSICVWNYDFQASNGKIGPDFKHKFQKC